MKLRDREEVASERVKDVRDQIDRELKKMRNVLDEVENQARLAKEDINERRAG